MDPRELAQALLDALQGVDVVPVPRSTLEALLAPAVERPYLPAVDQLLTVLEVAARLNVAPRTVYKRAKEYPFRISTDGRELRFSALGLDRYLAKRLTKKAR